MKKLAAILILTTICFNSIGYFFLHKHLQFTIRKEIKSSIKAGVPENELVKLIYSDATAHEFQWIHSKEFRYHGTMYDIVYRKKVTELTTILYCITDIQETKLFSKLDLYVSNTMKSSPVKARATQLLTQLFSGLFMPVKIQYEHMEITSDIKRTEIPRIYSIPCLMKSSPPPKA